MASMNDIFENISIYYKNKKYNELINVLLRFKSSDNVNPKLIFELGKVYFFNENYEEAEKYLKQSLNYNEFKLISLDLLGKIYKNKENITKMIEIYKSILDIDCNNKDAYKELINISFYDTKQYDISLDYVEKLLNLQEDDIYAHIIKIKIFVMLKKCNSEIKKECDILFNFIMQNKCLMKELLDLASFFVVNGEYDLSIYIINFIKSYSELKKDILSFFNSFQYDFACCMKFIRESNKDVEKIFIKYLEQIPEYAIKIRNMIMNELEIFYKKIVLKSKPRSVTVVLTNRCNLRCKMCNVWENAWDMSDKNIEEIKKIMPYLEYITWHGGEVFLHKRFLELFDFAQDCNIKQEIITNGLLINDDIIKKMIDYNIQLTLSIDSVNKETYEKIRCGAKFSTIIKVLSKLKLYRETQKNIKFKIRMNTILSYDNYSELFSFLDFVHEYNINEIYFFPLVFNLNNQYDLKNFVRLYTPVIEYFEKNKLKMLEKAKDLRVNIINTIPDLKVFNETIKKKINQENFYIYNTNDNECKSSFENKEMISYNKSIIENTTLKQIKCSVPWQRLRLDKVIRPHCFCKGNVNIGIIDDKFNIDNLWNCEYIQAYRKMIINENFKEFCNPSCYLGFVPEKQYNGIV